MSDAARTLSEETRYSYADYRAWELKPGERYELVGGEAYAMSAPNDQHQAIAAELTAQFVVFLRGKKCKVRPAPYDVRLFFKDDESDDTVVQPDLAVLCDETKRGPEGCRGAPDLVVEILSPSNTGEENIRKFNLYLKAGVREYWIVSPVSRTVQVFELENESDRGTVYDGSAPVPSTVLEGFSLSLDGVFPEFPAEK
jgi:Uma2 family endonuclease